MKKILSLLFWACLIGSTIFASAEEAEIQYWGSYTYTINNDGTICITGYIGSSVDINPWLTIPEEIDGRIVTVLGDRAFSDNILNGVTVPGSITSMEGNPFDGVLHGRVEITVAPENESFEVINGVLFSKPDRRLIYCTMDWDEAKEGFWEYAVPDGTRAVSRGAFSGCYFLESVYLPASLESMDGNPFFSCPNLTEIAVSPDNAYFEMIDGVLFSKADRRLICYPIAKTDEEYAIPEGTESVADCAFCGLDGYSSLLRLTIPDSVTSIGSRAFYGHELERLTIPGGVISIGDEAFSGTLIRYRDDPPRGLVVPGNVRSIGARAFSDNDLTELTISEGVVHIGDGAFANNEIETAAIPRSVTSVGGNPFSECRNLRAISVPKDHPYLETVDGVLFSKPDMRLLCYPLGWEKTEYSVPEGTKMIGNGAFSSCSLKKISLLGNVSSIGSNAFKYCVFSDFLIPDGVTEIGKSAFERCENLEKIVIPGSVAVIGNWAFSGCSSLKSVTFLEGKSTSVGGNAFAYSVSLADITPSGSVKVIGNAAFATFGFENASITMPDGPEVIGDYAQWR